MASEPTDGLNKKSPFAGCTILIIAGIVMLGVIGWSIYTLYYQEKEIAKFTKETPTPQKLLTVVGNEAPLNELKSHIDNFQAEIKAERPATLELSANDLNLAIAAFEEFSELRETFFVERIEKEHLHIGISYKLGNGVFTKRENHLVATLKAKPELHPGEVILTITNIDVPGSNVPDPILGHLSPHRITEVYKEHELLGPAMKALTSVTIENGKILLKADPSAPEVTTVPKEIAPYAERSIKLFGIIAIVFLSGVALILFIGRKAKSQ